MTATTISSVPSVRRGPIMSPGWARLLAIFFLLALWEIGARLYADPLFLCPPSQAVGALSHILSDPKIRTAIEVTIFGSAKMCWSATTACEGGQRKSGSA